MTLIADPTWRRAGAPRVHVLAPLPESWHVHALALALDAPALVERGGTDREAWHVLPLRPRGTLLSREGRSALTWEGAHGEGIAGELPVGPRGLDRLRQLTQGLACPPPDQDLPFAPGIVACLAYDLAHEIERLPSTTIDRDQLPWLVAVACPAALLVPVAGGPMLLAYLPDDNDAAGRHALPWGLTDTEAAALRERVERVVASRPNLLIKTPGGPVGDVVSLTTREQYHLMVRAVIEHLHAGDIYQANVSQRFEVAWEGSALPLHGVLRLVNPSPFSGWFRAPGWELVSGSPERLVRLRGRELTTEPIAGTQPLPDGPDTPPSVVADLTRDLLASGKDHAEHVMIVDLHRNDLGRVSAPGTVRVESMMRVDRRSHVLQAVADIRGVLADGKDAVDVIEAMFPAGCITGVPKIRCMEILDELEEWGRGPYTGSFGLVAAWGDLDLNVLIRSAWCANGRLAFAAGGGIVLDSDPEREWNESLAKAQALRGAVEALRARGASGYQPQDAGVG